jgi:hypothetical protein
MELEYHLSKKEFSFLEEVYWTSHSGDAVWISDKHKGEYLGVYGGEYPQIINNLFKNKLIDYGMANVSGKNVEIFYITIEGQEIILDHLKERKSRVE